VNADVVVVGAGPVGLTLATELRLAGAQVVVVEKLAQRSGQSKALNLQPSTAGVLDLRGLLSRANERSFGRFDGGHFAALHLCYEGLETRYPYQVAVLQGRVEIVLEERLAELGGELHRGWELTGVEQDDIGVTVYGPETLRTRYLVGCDGGRSTVRKRLSVAFPGADEGSIFAVCDVVLSDGTKKLPTVFTPFGDMRGGGAGSFAMVVPIGEPGLCRMTFVDHKSERTEVTRDEVARAVQTFYGADYNFVELRYASRHSNSSRQAETYRVGRAFLAGDAAHVHPSVGAQALNLGMQDAFNLGWKLGAVVTGRMPESLLDTYHAERHPVGARVIDNTRAQSALLGRDPEHAALRDIFKRLLDIPEANRFIADMIAGTDVDYGGPGHTGTRLPDFPIGSGWASDLFHAGHGVLFARDSALLAPSDPWADRVAAVLVDALPWADVEAVLVRPDGYACWTAPGPDLTTSLRTWFGEAPSAHYATSS